MYQTENTNSKLLTLYPSGVIHLVSMATALNIHQMFHWMNVSAIWVGLVPYVQMIADVITIVHVRFVLACVTIVKVWKPL